MDVKDVKQIFDHAAADYDRTRRQLVPCFDDFYDTALGLIPFEREADNHILDMGAGTGLLSALAAEAFPNASFTLADISTEMLARARERFAGRENFRYLVLDFESDAISGEYDVTMSAMALHHI